MIKNSRLKILIPIDHSKETENFLYGIFNSFRNQNYTFILCLPVMPEDESSFKFGILGGWWKRDAIRKLEMSLSKVYSRFENFDEKVELYPSIGLPQVVVEEECSKSNPDLVILPCKIRFGKLTVRKKINPEPISKLEGVKKVVPVLHQDGELLIPVSSSGSSGLKTNTFNPLDELRAV